jgi:hypothetical protein
MATALQQKWIEIAAALVADPDARLPCPNCEKPDLEVLDVTVPGCDGVYERHVSCEGCGARVALLKPQGRARSERSSSTLDRRFTKGAFTTADASERAVLCAELGAVLHQRLHDEPEFHTGVIRLIVELRALGHDLWSFDEDDDMEAWCPNYEVPTGPGIAITFKRDGVEVGYSGVSRS